MCCECLSEKCEATVHRDGKIHKQEYKIGIAESGVVESGTTGKTGTNIRFWPDYSIFVGQTFEYEIIDKRLRELAYLNSGIKIIFKDENVEKEATHFYEGGLSEFVKHLDKNQTPLFNEPVHIKGEKDGVPVEVALQYNTSYTETVLTFVNNINTIEGGTHLAGFKAALTRSLNKYVLKINLLKIKMFHLGRRCKRGFQPFFQ